MPYSRHSRNNWKGETVSFCRRRLTNLYSLAICLAILAVIFFVKVQESDKTSLPPQNQNEQDSNINIQESHRRSGVAFSKELLPSKLIQFLNCDVFEEDTGEVTSKIFDYFHIKIEDRAPIRREIAAALNQFQIKEASRAEVISTPQDSYILLKDCSDSASGAFDNLATNLEHYIWANKAKNLTNLMKKQLRDGGKNPVEVALTMGEGGQYMFSKKIFYPNGGQKSFEEYYITGTDFSEMARWQHLSHLTEPPLKDK